MKLKTKKALIKRLNVSATRLKRGNAFKRHNLRRRTTNMKRQATDLVDVHPSHERMIKKLAPYIKIKAKRVRSIESAEVKG
ncbi:large ribosomal subunit protein bL35 [Candidatus Cytomitobacter primus]|uniref:50S ribosomal protein L35 n=1 Tax=Candidatus Cytomitobacter primus TaxID=2066024 RepID=A0A5C0UFP2_9PROT|nr:50S ribosomal protein L35 [Candidatus Cytomitobacter primus]QEK38540.1 50S ribosomal protein L35 [Candidatus Cytomitobacter primus]